MTVRIATRGSDLARWQANHVASLLGGDADLVLVETTGDRRADESIAALGGKGVFVKEVQAAVLDGRADIAVHSAKDLPSQTFDGLALAAVPPRGDARDALVGRPLAELPPGALVATGSARRRAQLADARPDLTFTGLRGNIPTRLEKAAKFDAVVVAAVALERLGLAHRIAEILPTTVLVPQVGQGALAIECRVGDSVTRTRLAGIEHPPSRRAVDAERAFLAALGGDCDLPAGAYATVDNDGFIALEGLLASLDGRIVLRYRQTGLDPQVVGREVAQHLLDGCGGRTVLDI